MNNLQDHITYVLELDSKRMQELKKSREILTKGFDRSKLDKTKYIELESLTPAQDEFIAAAPLMALIIRSQQEQLRVAREALVKIAKGCDAVFLDAGLADSQVHPDVLLAISEDAKQALSLIGSSQYGSDQFQLQSNEIGDKS